MEKKDIILNVFGDKNLYGYNNIKYCNAVRLIYVDLNKKFNQLDRETYIEENYFVSNPYFLPKGMNMSSALCVLSDVADNVQYRVGKLPQSIDGASIIASMLTDKGFVRDDSNAHNVMSGKLMSYYNYKYYPVRRAEVTPIDGVADLFLVDEDEPTNLFFETEYAERYFDWRNFVRTRERMSVLPNSDFDGDELAKY